MRARSSHSSSTTTTLDQGSRPGHGEDEAVRVSKGVLLACTLSLPVWAGLAAAMLLLARP